MGMMPGKPTKEKDGYIFNIPDICPKCNGKRFDYDAFIDGTGPLHCEKCGGEGVVV